jgi:hypothetical protein
MSSASSFAPSSFAFSAEKHSTNIVLRAQPRNEGRAYQDMLGVSSSMSLSNVDSAQLTAIHPERSVTKNPFPSRIDRTPSYLVKHQPTESSESVTLNAQDKLGPYPIWSLSNTNSRDLTGMDRGYINRRPAATVENPTTMQLPESSPAAVMPGEEAAVHVGEMEKTIQHV